MTIADVERARLRAIVDGDRAVLEELLHPEFTLCTPSGELWGRASYLDGLCDGASPTRASNPSPGRLRP